MKNFKKNVILSKRVTGLAYELHVWPDTRLSPRVTMLIRDWRFTLDMNGDWIFMPSPQLMPATKDVIQTQDFVKRNAKHIEAYWKGDLPRDVFIRRVNPYD